MSKPQFNLNSYDPKTIIVMNIPILRKININSLKQLYNKIDGIEKSSNHYFNIHGDISSDGIDFLQNLSGFFHFVETSFITKNSHGLLSFNINDKNNFMTYINNLIESIVQLNSNIGDRFFAQNLRTALSLKGDLLTALNEDKNQSTFNPVSCNIYSTANNKNSLSCKAKTRDNKVKVVPLLSEREETRNWIARSLDDVFYTDTIVLHFPESTGLSVKNSAIYFYFSLMFVLQNLLIDCIKQRSNINFLGTINESIISDSRDVYSIPDNVNFNSFNDILCILNEFCSVFQIQINIKEQTIKHKIDGHVKNNLVYI